VLALLCPVSGAAAAGALFTTVGQPAVPAGGAVGAGESATFTSISCAAPGQCVAGGSYRTSAGGQLAMIDTETNGIWAPPQRVLLPAGATTVARNEHASISSVSCVAQGFCVAVGSYRGSGSGTLVVSELAGTWSTATTLPSITDEITGGGALDSVSCTSLGNCTAVGTSATTRGLIEPTIATETDGAWARPLVPALPAGDLQTVPTTLSVSCPAAGDCVVAGTDYPVTGPQLPLLIVQSGGRWQQAETLGPLSGALADAGQAISLGALDCSGVAECTAVGNDDTAGGASGFALVDSGGSFTEVGLPYPAGGPGFLAEDPTLGLDAVGCADADDCTAAGGFPTGGTPAQPTAAAMTAVEDDGGWSDPVWLPAPGDAAPPPSGVATVRALSCPQPGQCEGAGGYENAAGQQLPMLAVSVPALSVAGGSLAPAQLGHPYSAQLTATGGAGATTWTVSAGTLPIGLTLNPATGVISGTPRFVQSSTFTVTAADAGPPVQTASASLSLTVSTQAPPPPRLSALRIWPRRVSAAGRRVGRRCEPLTRRDRHRRPCARPVRVSLHVRMSADATVRLTATRVLAGRQVRRGLVLRCVAPTRRTRHDRRCTRSADVRGHELLDLAAGSDTVRWQAVLDGRPLGPGTYRLRLVPSASGSTGGAMTATVRITGGPSAPPARSSRAG
jgi:putative Ig domain-containing protein